MSEHDPTDTKLQLGLFPIEEYEKGKDELNMAEYPLSLAGKTLGPRRGSIATFTDQIRDKGTGKLVDRTVIISAPQDLGLPTYYDEEVLFGILQLTNMRRLPDGSWPKTVSFTRHELAKLLGLKHGGSSYKRVRDSITRVAGTTYRFQFAFFDNAAEEWQNAVIMNFIQHVHWSEGPNGRGQVTLTWNDEIHKSFESGYLRDINYLEYRAMKLPLAKALYRFLGKHFWRSRKLKFDLHTLAYEKLGLSRSYDTGQIKRALEPALRRLEERGYLVPMTRQERFTKVRAGKWNIHFEQLSDKKPQKSLEQAVPTALELELVKQGVTRSAAVQLVADATEKLIREKLDVLAWLIDRDKAPENPGGWLVTAIREVWDNPTGYQSPQEVQEARETKERKQAESDSRAAEKREADQAYQRVVNIQRETADAYLSKLSEDERAALQKKALAEVPEVMRKAPKTILRNYVIRELEEEGVVPKLPSAPAK